MALGILLIMNIIIVLGVVIAQIFLYREPENKKFFMINLALGVLLSFLVFTSLPTNYTAQRVFSLVLGGLAVVAYFLQSKEKSVLLSKVLLSIAIVGNLIQLFI